MKQTVRKLLPLLLVAGILAMSGMAVSCKSSEKTMYERKQSNKSVTVKSSIKVKGSSKANGPSTRTY